MACDDDGYLIIMYKCCPIVMYVMNCIFKVKVFCVKKKKKKNYEAFDVSFEMLLSRKLGVYV